MVEDLPCSGCLSIANVKENIKEIKQIFLENLHASLRELATKLNIVYGMAQHILISIWAVRQVATRLIPKYLTFIQKHHQKAVFEELISEVKNDPTFVKWITTGQGSV